MQLCLEVLPSLLPFGAGFTWLASSHHVQRLLYAYEAVVYNRYCDLEQALPLVLLGVAMLMLYQRMRRRRQVGKRATGTGSSAETADLNQVVVTKAE